MQADGWQGRRKGARAEPLPLTRTPPGAGCARPSAWELAGGTIRLGAVPAFKAAYLIHGDDHGRLAERRARLRAMAEAESGSAGVELFEPDVCTPDAIAAALSAMT